MAVVYEKNLSEPWFTLIKLKIKKVEGRLNKGEISNMKIGDTIIFTNNELKFERKFSTIITDINYYDNFESYLKSETLKKCLPGIDEINDGINIYHNYYSKEDEIKYKIKALTLDLL